MSLPRPRAVIFDWDNTLVDSWAAIHAALCDAFRALGRRPWTLDETRAWVRRSMREALPELFGPRSGEAKRVFYASYARHAPGLIKVLPGVREMLGALRGEGLFLAVLSNKDGPYLRAEAERLGLAPLFARLVGAEDAPQDKPSPRAVAAALEGSGLAAGPAVWLVGDAEIDLVCARRAGCTAVLISGPPSADARAPGAHWRVETVAELVRLATGRRIGPAARTY